MSIQLQVGKCYRDRHGDVVKIVKEVEDDPDCRFYTFMSACGEFFAEDGRWRRAQITQFDLIEEVSEEEANSGTSPPNSGTSTPAAPRISKPSPPPRDYSKAPPRKIVV